MSFEHKCPSCNSKVVKEFNSNTNKKDAVTRCPDPNYSCQDILKEKQISFSYTKIKPDLLIIRGDNVSSLLKEYDDKIKLITFNMSSIENEVVDYIINLDNYLVVGIGNMVGWGDKFLNNLKRYYTND